MVVAVLCAAAALVAPPSAEAGMTYVVGDGAGWMRNLESWWLAGKTFRAGDVLGKRMITYFLRARSSCSSDPPTAVRQMRSVQLRQGEARPGVGEQGRLPEVRRVAAGPRAGLHVGPRPRHAAPGHALLHLRQARPLRQRHEARRHRVLIMPFCAISGRYYKDPCQQS